MDRDELVTSGQDNRRAQDVAVGQALELDVGQLVLIMAVEQVTEPPRSWRELTEDPAVSRIRHEVAHGRRGRSDRRSGCRLGDTQYGTQAARKASDDHEAFASEDLNAIESASRRLERISARRVAAARRTIGEVSSWARSWSRSSSSARCSSSAGR